MKKTSWGAVAGWYEGMIEGGDDTYQKMVLLPNLIRIVNPKPGMTILDVACGQGYFSRAFAQSGATVIGCDISPELIELAKKNFGHESGQKKVAMNATKGDANFYVAPSDHFISHIGRDSADQASSEGFADVAMIVLALQNIENLQGTIAECSKALNAGGRLVIILNHPAFRIPQNSSWQWEAAEKEYRRIDSYMSDKQFEIDMTPGEAVASKKKFTVSFHRPLQSYFKALSKSGLAVTRLEEWISHKKSQAGPRATEEDRMRKEIPMFICLEAIKI